MVNISPSNIFQTLVLFERYQQNWQAVFGILMFDMVAGTGKSKARSRNPVAIT